MKVNEVNFVGVKSFQVHREGLGGDRQGGLEGPEGCAGLWLCAEPS